MRTQTMNFVREAPWDIAVYWYRVFWQDADKDKRFA
jgi:hypothetical protein